ncbi:hypothetical protein ACTMTJ_10835 [Phytohabitans sp. LJ34]|uniref:hypothetical protein n=1 Tax=Phytohabitans sp. LJ34 TaxID=3452217 RepID=UPI003F8BE859
MTGQEFSEVDIDLLADYVGGALDGTPEEAVVARRVAEEPAWAEAHSALSEATEGVRASLASWGASAEPMPAEVADRITAALAQEPHRPALSLVPDDPDGPPRTASRSRRRLPGWAAPAAIAAGVVAIAGLGLSQADHLGSGDEGSAAGTVADAPAGTDSNAEAVPNAVRGVMPVTVSGRNYGDLASAAPPAMPASGPVTAQDEAERQLFGTLTTLDRLRDPAARAACIEAIATVHPLGVSSVDVVDLASFRGSPAAIVFFTDSSGARWVWASGPECGLAARGADTRGSAKIG